MDLDPKSSLKCVYLYHFRGPQLVVDRRGPSRGSVVRKATHLVTVLDGNRDSGESVKCDV